jgi:hypothetical protein
MLVARLQPTENVMSETRENILHLLGISRWMTGREIAKSIKKFIRRISVPVFYIITWMRWCETA